MNSFATCVCIFQIPRLLPAKTVTFFFCFYACVLIQAWSELLSLTAPEAFNDHCHRVFQKQMNERISKVIGHLLYDHNRGQENLLSFEIDCFVMKIILYWLLVFRFWKEMGEEVG